MMKYFFILILIIGLLGCDRHQEDQHSYIIDSLMQEYIASVDSSVLVNEGEIRNYYILKRYFYNDTMLEEFLLTERWTVEISKERDSIIRDMFDSIKLQPLHSIDCNSVYRLWIYGVFVNDLYFVTAYKKDSSYFLSSIQAYYNPGDTSAEFNFDIQYPQKVKNISKLEWDSIQSLVNGSYFWSMYNEGPDMKDYHGSFWRIDGRINYYDGRVSKHHVIRRRPPSGSFKNLGLYLIELADFDIGELSSS